VTLRNPVSLGDVHSELSCLLHAVQTGLKDLGVTVEINYNQNTYLDVVVDIWNVADPKKNRLKIEAVVARLQHGILHDEYDYRFRGICHPVLSQIQAYENLQVVASVDLCHWPHRRPHGWEEPKARFEWPLSGAGKAAAAYVAPGPGGTA
jgi:hypothetical protein